MPVDSLIDVERTFFWQDWQWVSWQQWSSVALGDRKLLPSEAGIYIVADKHHFIWYVRQVAN